MAGEPNVMAGQSSVMAGEPSVMAGQPRRPLVGLIIPSSNPTIERCLQSTPAVAAAGMDVISTRVRVRRIAAEADGQFALAPMAEAVGLLVDAEPDLVVWAGTSGFWRGEGVEAAELAELSGRFGIPVTSSRAAVLAALADGGSRQVALLTPYTADVHHQVRTAVAADGFTVVRDRYLDESDNLAFSRMGAGLLAPAIDELTGPEGLPVAVVCTNVWAAFPGAAVVDSVVATLWHAARLAGTDPGRYRDYHSVVVGEGPQVGS